MNKILQLARTAKALLLVLPMLFFAAGAEAAPCDGMLGEQYERWASKINTVPSIKVNGLDLTERTTTQQWRKTFGKKGIVTGVSHAFMEYIEEGYIPELGGECIPLHIVTVSYPDKTIRLTLPLNNYEKRAEFEALKFNQDFVNQNDNWETQLNIDWNMNKSKDSLVVGESIIRSGLSFAAFKKMFPLSAQQSLAALVALAGYNEEWQHERMNDTQTYVVDINSRGCLNKTLEFTFSNGKLNRLALRHYETWCSC